MRIRLTKINRFNPLLLLTYEASIDIASVDVASAFHSSLRSTVSTAITIQERKNFALLFRMGLSATH